MVHIIRGVKVLPENQSHKHVAQLLSKFLKTFETRLIYEYLNEIIVIPLFLEHYNVNDY